MGESIAAREKRLARQRSYSSARRAAGLTEDRERRNARQREYMRARRLAGVALPRYVDRACPCGQLIAVRADKPTRLCSSCTARAGRHAQGGLLTDAERREKRRMRRASRDARKRGAFVAPVYRTQIFARDGYRCLLCGDLLAMRERVPHPLAPTIDHVVPLARGGWHAPDNVQAAHFLCNSRKSDRIEVS